MKKIAIAVTGNTRGFYSKWVEHVLPILKKIENSELVIFFQLWDNNHIPDAIKNNKFVMDNIGFETEVFKPINIYPDNIIVLSQRSIYETIQSFIGEDRLYNSIYHNLFKSTNVEIDYASYVDLCNYYSQPYSWSRVYNHIQTYEQQHGIFFDYLIKLRYDCFFRDDFSNILNDFCSHGSDLMTGGRNLWTGNKVPEMNDNIIPNGISDLWFIVKKSAKTDIIFENLTKQMFKTNHQNTTLFGKRMIFENCFYVSLISLNCLLSTKHYSSVLMRNHDFDKTYERFLKHNAIPEYTHAPSVVMNQRIFKNLEQGQ